MDKSRLKKLYNGFVGESLRYVLVGGSTTLVDLGVTALFYRALSFTENASNIAGIIAAILYAYVLNKLFVFRSNTDTFGAFALEFLSFIAGRLLGMGVEVVGVHLLVNTAGQPLMVGKVETLVIVAVLNYVITKFLVFRKRRRTEQNTDENDE